MLAGHFRDPALVFAFGWLLLVPALSGFAADRVSDSVPEDPPSVLAPEGEPDARLLEFGKLFSERIVGKKALPEDRARILSLLETTPHTRTLLPFVIASLGDPPTASPDFPRLAGIARANPTAGLLNLSLGELLLASPKKEETESEKAARLEQAYGFLRTAYLALTDDNAPVKPEPDKETRLAVMKYMMVCLLQGKERELNETIRRMKSIPRYHDDPEISAAILLTILDRLEKNRPLAPLLLGPMPDKAFSLQCDFSEAFPHYLDLLADGRFPDMHLPGQLNSILVRKGKTEEVRCALLSWILRTDGKLAGPLELLAAVEEVSGNLMAAGRLAEIVLATGKAKDPVRLIFAAANTYRSAGEPRRALSLLKKYEGRIRDKAALAGHYIQLYLMLHDIPSAMKTAAQLPEGHVKYIQLMMMQKDQKQWLEAAESGRKALSFIRKNKLKLRENTFYLVYCDILEKIEDMEGIRAVLEPLIQEDPDDPELLNFLGYVLADHNLDLDHAHDLIRRALKKKPDSAAILDSMAWVLYRQGRFQEAETYILKSLGQCGDQVDATILDHAGDIYNALGDKEKAAGFWLRAFENLKETGSDPKLENAVRKKLSARL